MTKHIKIENKTKSKKYVVVLELMEDDYYADNIDELRYEIQEMLYVGGSVRIKPMPEKKIHNPTYYTVNGLGGAFELERHKGYNACIDEILGEE